MSVIGGDAKEYQIQLDPERMKAMGVSLAEVADAVETLNDNAAGGVVYDYGNEYLIKGDISTADPSEISLAVIRSDENGTVTLADVSETVVAGAQPRIGTASLRGEPAVLITVTKQSATGTGALTARIDAELDAMKRTFPAGVEVSTDIFRQNDFIDNSIGNLQRSLFEGAIFVVIVLFFFLMLSLIHI